MYIPEFFDLTQESFCSQNEKDFARSKTADFRSGIFRFRSRIRVGLTTKSLLVNIGEESALSLHTPLCSDVVTWAVDIILVPNGLCS